MKRSIMVCIILFAVLTKTGFSQWGSGWNYDFGGYADKTSYFPGDTVTLYISNNLSDFELKVYRVGNENSPVFDFQHVQGKTQPIADSAYFYGCNWTPTLSFVLPQKLVSGIYLAEFMTQTELRRIVFIVKNPTLTNDILFVISTNSYQAQNDFGGKSLYTFNSTNYTQSPKVSFLRPYTGLGDGFLTGVPYMTNWGFYIPETGWEAQTSVWLDKNGFKVDYCTDSDLDSTTDITNGYRIVLIAGHSEYWSWGMRYKLEDYVKAGGKLVVLGGNTCWFQVRYENNHRTLVCYKDAKSDPMSGVADSLVTVSWPTPPVNRSETPFLGETWTEGGLVNYISGPDSILPASKGYGGYVVIDADYWVFNGTNLKDLDKLGLSDTIVGYETDGHRKVVWTAGYATGAGETVPPESFRVLARHPGCNFPPPDGSRRGNSTMGIYYNMNGGAVFNAGTTGWPHGLQRDSAVVRITRNVLNRFLSGHIPPDFTLISPLNLKNAVVYGDTMQYRSCNLTLMYGDSIDFAEEAEGRNGLPLNYFWTINGNSVSIAQGFQLNSEGLADQDTLIVRGFAYDTYDTSIVYTKVVVKNIEITSVPTDSVVKVGQKFDYNLQVSTARPGDSVAVKIKGLPAWAYYMTATRTIEGVPSSGDSGVDTILIVIIDSAGNWDAQSVRIEVVDTSSTLTVTASKTPSGFALFQDYPNPFNPSTVIIYQLPAYGHVILKVYDIMGREIVTLVDGNQSAGFHSVKFNGSKLSSGVYLCQLKAGSYSSIKKMMMLK